MMINTTDFPYIVWLESSDKPGYFLPVECSDLIAVLDVLVNDTYNDLAGGTKRIITKKVKTRLEIKQ